jgi:phage terminase large subunit-like protein
MWKRLFLLAAAVGCLMGSLVYRPDTCAWCGADTWCELRANGAPQCRACKIELFYEQVLYPPLGYRLLPWWRKVIRDLYGTVEPETGLRRYRRAYISLGKQNGKSYGTGGLPIYHLLMEDERDPEAYGCAAAREQAGIVFKAAAGLVNVNPVLLARLRVLPSTKRIVRRDGAGIYTVLSADGDVQDGIRPSLLIRDEIHRWKTARAETLRDVTTKGQISRDEPLDIQITTAGAEFESPLWWSEYEFAKLVQANPDLALDYYVAIWEADAKRLEEDPEYWKSREARVAANPSHEDLGGHLKDKAIVSELAKALVDPSKRPAYLRYHLNVPIRTSEEPVIDMPRWKECGGGVDLREWPTYDYELLVRKWGLAEKPCYAGVDASWTSDLTAVVFVFPPFEGAAEWTLLPFAWVPKGRMHEIERTTRQPITTWVRQGFIEATPGNGIDLRYVKDRIKWGRQLFDLREMPFDRTNFRHQAMEMVDEGALGPKDAVEVQQNFLQLSAPTKFLLVAYTDRKIRHGNNPVLNWNAGCLALQYDRKDNVQPEKPERMKSQKRIDMISATVTALNRALEAAKPFVSVYANPTAVKFQSTYARRG